MVESWATGMFDKANVDISNVKGRMIRFKELRAQGNFLSQSQGRQIDAVGV